MAENKTPEEVARAAFLSNDILDHWSAVPPRSEEERQRMRRQAAADIAAMFPQKRRRK